MDSLVTVPVVHFLHRDDAQEKVNKAIEYLNTLKGVKLAPYSCYHINEEIYS
jgi:hypothetical protein